MKFLAALLVFCAAAWPQQPDEIHLRDGIFTVTNLTITAEPPEGWFSVFPVYAAGNETQPMLGTYSFEGSTLTFRPRFPIARGVSYQAKLISKGALLTAAVFDPAPAPPPSTRVTAIYPSTDKLPVNTLRLYIYFSAPMSRGEALQHIHLVTDDGKNARQAFLEIDQELWDPALRRLTLLFDPGRIKRGLVPAQQLGTPLKEGLHYTLSIDKDWHDAQGVTLTQSFEKSFTAIAADRTAPAPKLWRIVTPRADTLDPLIVTFPKPMDHALLQRMLQVDGVPGRAVIAQNETAWRFTPGAPWHPGTYSISAENLLEDISGNHLDRPFDVDLSTQAPASVGERRLTLPFAVR